MKKDTVIIIDTGIEIKSFKDRIVGGRCFYLENDKILYDDNIQDDNGHGTACASIILKLNPCANFYVIKILDKNAETSLPILITALEHCATLDYNLINLSLAILDTTESNELETICKVLKDAGKIIFASVYNGHYKSYPAVYNSVIGVIGSRLNSSHDIWFNSNLDVQCVADITPEFTNRHLERYFLFGGNSKACASATGFAMNILSKTIEDISYDMVCSILERKALRNTWTDCDLNISLFYDSYNHLRIENYINEVNVIKKTIYAVTLNDLIYNINWNDNLFEKGILYPNHCKYIIESMERIFGIEIQDTDITFKGLSCISEIIKTIEGANLWRN